MSLATPSWVLNGGALGVEHGLEVDQATAVALAGQQGGIAGGVRGQAQAGQALSAGTQGHQGVFHLLQGAQHGSAPGLLRLRQCRLLYAHLGTLRTTVEDRQRHAGEQAAPYRMAAAERIHAGRSQAQ
jgi:hypothetical protein